MHLSKCEKRQLNPQSMNETCFVLSKANRPEWFPTHTHKQFFWFARQPSAEPAKIGSSEWKWNSGNDVLFSFLLYFLIWWNCCTAVARVNVLISDSAAQKSTLDASKSYICSHHANVMLCFRYLWMRAFSSAAKPPSRRIRRTHNKQQLHLPENGAFMHNSFTSAVEALRATALVWIWRTSQTDTYTITLEYRSRARSHQNITLAVENSLNPQGNSFSFCNTLTAMIHSMRLPLGNANVFPEHLSHLYDGLSWACLCGSVYSDREIKESLSTSCHDAVGWIYEPQSRATPKTHSHTQTSDIMCCVPHCFGAVLNWCCLFQTAKALPVSMHENTHSPLSDYKSSNFQNIIIYLNSE